MAAGDEHEAGLAEWLAVERRARAALRPPDHWRWCWLVGTEGTPHQWAVRGRAILADMVEFGHLTPPVRAHVEPAQVLDRW